MASRPTSDVRPYAEGRDRAVCAALHECLGEPTVEGELLASTAWAVAATPATQGGLGLQSAMRTAPAAYWGAWADTLGYWHVRQPRLAAACVQALERGGAGRPALSRGPCRCKPSAKRGMAGVPHLGQHSLSTPCAAPRAREAGPGDWPHGWAVPRIAYTLTLFPRSSATALLGAGSPCRRCCCPSRVPKPPRGSRPYPRTGPPRCRQKSCRSCFADVSVYASASGTRPLRPTWARMPKTVRPLGRPCARLHTQRPLGTPGEAG